MTDRGRLPSRWACAVVATWGVAGFLWHVAVRDVAVWLAAVVSVGLVALALLAMMLTRLRRPRKPARRTENVDIFAAKPNRLVELATDVAGRVQEWTTDDLDAGARANAQEAQEAIDGVVAVVQNLAEARLPSEDVVRRVRSSLQVITVNANHRPRDAGGWYRLKNNLEEQHRRLRDAVDADRDNASN